MTFPFYFPFILRVLKVSSRCCQENKLKHEAYRWEWPESKPRCKALSPYIWEEARHTVMGPRGYQVIRNAHKNLPRQLLLHYSQRRVNPSLMVIFLQHVISAKLVTPCKPWFTVLLIELVYFSNEHVFVDA